MERNGSDRRLYRFLRDSAIIAQTAGIICLTTFIDYAMEAERIATFVALSMLASKMVAKVYFQHFSTPC
jgi:hypothetical protein